jgi:hypothetical protein
VAQEFDSEMSAETKDNMTGGSCGEWQPLLTLSAADGELDAAEQSRLAAHLVQCRDCSAAFERERELLSALGANRADVDASLLAGCRAGLEDALDREEERGWLRRSLGLLLPTYWISPRPAWGAAVLLFIGFSVGIFAPRLLRHPVAGGSPDNAGNTGSATSLGNSAPSDSTASVPVDSAPASLDLRTADVAGINVLPAGGGEPARVELQLRSHQPLMVQGTVDDDDVKGVLLNVLSSGDRSCPDLRLDALECLRQRSNDPEVRSALCRALRKDPNDAVRLKALEALGGAEPQEIIRNTMLDALVDDQNPGVRIEAIDALRDMAEKGQVAPDGRVVAVLRERMRKDPSTYIRLQSAAAIRDLGPREKF